MTSFDKEWRKEGKVQMQRAVSFRPEPACVYSVIGRTRVNETGEEKKYGDGKSRI